MSQFYTSTFLFCLARTTTLVLRQPLCPQVNLSALGCVRVKLGQALFTKAPALNNLPAALVHFRLATSGLIFIDTDVGSPKRQ